MFIQKVEKESNRDNKKCTSKKNRTSTPGRNKKVFPKIKPDRNSIFEQSFFHGNGILGNHTNCKISQPGDKYEPEVDRMTDTVARSPVSVSRSKQSSMLHTDGGNHPLLRKIESGQVNLSQPGDKSEREADQMADCVMRMSQPLGRTEIQGTSAGLAGRSNSRASSELTPSRGEPLPKRTREFFEPRFWYDFSDVRVHTGTNADEAARSIQSEAFTIGTDITFAGGNYQPSMSDGKKLLAHELAHVVQQGAGERRHEAPGTVPAPEAPVRAMVQRQAGEAPACGACPNPVNPDVSVDITPLVKNGTPSGSPFGSTNWGTANMRQLSVWHRERRTCNTCNVGGSQRDEWELCPRSIYALATVDIIIDRNEITRNNPATGEDWWTECGPSPGADRFATEATINGVFNDPKRKTVAGVIHHERYHVGVSEDLLKSRIEARNDIQSLCPYRTADIQSWKSTLETTIRSDAETFLRGNPNEANEETNASNAECTRY